jgi:transcriptional regulator with XRE-family HTH domain
LKLLKAERQMQGVSLSDVEERAGIGRSALSRLENETEPNSIVVTLTRYAEALGEKIVVSFERGRRAGVRDPLRKGRHPQDPSVVTSWTTNPVHLRPPRKASRRKTGSGRRDNPVSHVSPSRAPTALLPPPLAGTAVSKDPTDSQCWAARGQPQTAGSPRPEATGGGSRRRDTSGAFLLRRPRTTTSPAGDRDGPGRKAWRWSPTPARRPPPGAAGRGRETVKLPGDQRALPGGQISSCWISRSEAKAVRSCRPCFLSC